MIRPTLSHVLMSSALPVSCLFAVCFETESHWSFPDCPLNLQSSCFSLPSSLSHHNPILWREWYGGGTLSAWSLGRLTARDREVSKASALAS